jgi:hypothetical protein
LFADLFNKDKLLFSKTNDSNEECQLNYLALLFTYCPFQNSLSLIVFETISDTDATIHKKAHKTEFASALWAFFVE